ncbi:uncharacterized protein LOC121990404 [Zingiber officinale]|uniref:Homologous recombination OB-fold protein OB-fold domain-containing protein n=1 Tax=Zingiber officinale TaxID=94328 RepID=A0A8J5FV22_ZINOF|nr:uncharacterized protein LOC121990404 [Zingiber officinale]KAG6496490.1 hypothetical protein ZIOFF_044357 [Zingiber officinale]
MRNEGVAEAEAEVEALPWEDAIDVDDSDLFPLLAPSSSSSHPRTICSPQIPLLRSCSQFPRPLSQPVAATPRHPPSPTLSSEGPPPSSSRIIPGPAGAVQVAMRRQSAADAARREGLLSRGERSNHGRELEAEEEDGDFRVSPWLRALEFLGGDRELVWRIDSIKTRAAHRVPQVVGIVTSCTPNGLGDLFLTLKDPTGSIGAFVHHGVLSDCNLGGDISVGCVLILKQVVVFCPAHSIHLNVTSKNVVKLIRKDCTSPPILPLNKSRGHNMESGFGTSGLETSYLNSTKTILDDPSKLEYDNRATMANLNKVVAGGLSSEPRATVCNKRAADWTDLEFMESGNQLAAGECDPRPKLDCHEEMRKTLNLQSTTVGIDKCATTLPCRIQTADVTTLLSCEQLYSLPNNTSVAVAEAAVPLTAHKSYTDKEKRNMNSGKITDSTQTDAAKRYKCDDMLKTTTSSFPANSGLRTTETKRIISGVSVAQWTDEQLSELFADYTDDADLVNFGF